MKRPLKPEEKTLWGLVAATVRPLSGQRTPKTLDAPARLAPADLPGPPPPRKAPAEGIEPNRRHRIAKEREEIGARLDLHDMTQERARPALEAFIARAWNDGHRAVLVITGKGLVLRKAAPGWLEMLPMVAGVSEAARHHGGGGALYVALKRKA